MTPVLKLLPLLLLIGGASAYEVHHYRIGNEVHSYEVQPEPYNHNEIEPLEADAEYRLVAGEDAPLVAEDRLLKENNITGNLLTALTLWEAPQRAMVFVVNYGMAVST